MKLVPGKTYSFFLLREFLKVFIISIVFIAGLSYIVKILQGLDDWKEYGVLQTIILRLLEAPNIISRQALFASCLFSSVYTISTLTKNREILALRSCGVSVYRIISPLIIFGFFIGISQLFFENYVVVPSTRAKDRVLARIQGDEPEEYYRDRRNLMVFGEGGLIYKIDFYSSKQREMSQVLILSKNSDGNVEYRITAEKGRWNGKSWDFFNGVVQYFSPEGSMREQQQFSILKTAIADDPRYFGRDTRKIEDMTFGEGVSHVRMMKKMGFNYRKELTKLHRKIADSVTLFLVIIIGLALGSIPFRNALVISFSMTIGIVLVFLFIIELGYTFGSSGKIPPAVGGWLGNIVFGFICVYLLKRQRV
jgi:lipopolysaccharide export system permease protein